MPPATDLNPNSGTASHAANVSTTISSASQSPPQRARNFVASCNPHTQASKGKTKQKSTTNLALTHFRFKMTEYSDPIVCDQHAQSRKQTIQKASGANMQPGVPDCEQRGAGTKRGMEETVRARRSCADLGAEMIRTTKQGRGRD